MYARVSDFRVASDKLPLFLEALHSLIPLIHRERGFRSVVVLRSGLVVRVTSVWDSLEDLQASEKSMFLYQALSRVLAHAQGFPVMEECEVLLADFVPERPASRSSAQA
jgi:heme-degrading monooxygenase HmoA